MSSSDEMGAVPRSRHILTSTGWNIIGRIVPVFVAILATPRLIHMLGLSRWGIFTIALSLTVRSGFLIWDWGARSLVQLPIVLKERQRPKRLI